MPIGMRSIKSVIMTTMPITPTNSEVSIGQFLFWVLADRLERPE